MSPEALGEPPVYTDKLDSFSLGVLGVQIMTRQFPDPGDRFQVVAILDPRFPSGSVKVDIPEIERRQSHISLINPDHPLLPVALDCLNDKDRERPSCHELCGRISTLKASPMYTESVQQSQVRTEPAQSERTNREKEVQQSQQIRDLQQQLQGLELENEQQKQEILGLQVLLTARNDQLHACQQQLSSKDEQLASKHEQLAGKDHQLQEKEAEIAARQQEIQQLRQQVKSSEQVIAEFQRNLERGDPETVLDQQRQIRELQQQLRKRGGQRQEKEEASGAAARGGSIKLRVLDQQRQIRELQQQMRKRGGQRQEKEEASGAAASGGSIKLRWRGGGWAPCEMYGEVVAVNGSVAFFRPGGGDQNTVFSYDSAKNNWSKVPRCPSCDFSLAVVNNLLTAIGGRTLNWECTSSLLSLTDKKWTKQFLHMPTKRCLTAVVCSGRSLMVAGGVGGGYKYLSTVEVMDTESLQWSTASSLPHRLIQATATLCGDRIYMLGGLGGFERIGQHSKSVFTCSLSTLLQSCHKSRSLMKTLSLASTPKVWHQLADTPVTLSTCASLHGRLLAVCGMDSDKKQTSAIHAYNTTTNSWEIVSHMATPRFRCLAAVLLHSELMVVGGCAPAGDTNSVEIATIV